MAGHPAVSAEVPYSEKLLTRGWSNTSFNVKHKLEVRLPCDVSQKAVTHFLRHVNGDPQTLRTVMYVYPTDASLLQVRASA
jgi:hypothetical protein